MTDPTVSRLLRWAAARERRNPCGHGKTGTALLREAAERIESLQAALEVLAIESNVGPKTRQRIAHAALIASSSTAEAASPHKEKA